MELSIIDTLEGTGLLGALPAKEATEARQLLRNIKALPAKERRLVRACLATVPAPPLPADIEGLAGWWADAKKKTGKALKKIGAAKILAAATSGIPLIGPIVGPLAAKAVSALDKADKGDQAGAAQERQEIRQIAEQAAGAAAITVQTQAPLPGQVVRPVNWLLIGGLAIGGLVAMKALGGRR